MAPLLDVSDVLTDPMFVEPLLITRQNVTVGNNGRATVTQEVITPKPYGVVTSEADDDVIVGEDALLRPNMIRVTTKFRIQGPSKEGERDGDIVTWNGDPYIVMKIDNFSKWGAGFMTAVCQSMSSVDNPPGRR